MVSAGRRDIMTSMKKFTEIKPNTVVLVRHDWRSKDDAKPEPPYEALFKRIELRGASACAIIQGKRTKSSGSEWGQERPVRAELICGVQ